MKYALVNPRWTFEGSTYFGCREAHLPLEFGYAKALLEGAGHDVLLIDAHLDDFSRADVVKAVTRFGPDFTVVTTAPTYLFWRCPPAELRHPQAIVHDLRDVSPIVVGVGPHCSSTPAGALKKLQADLLVVGEFEMVLPLLPLGVETTWQKVPSVCLRDTRGVQAPTKPFLSDMAALPPLKWPDNTIRKHAHQHHRFDVEPKLPGAEMEASRGCPYHCSFCAKENFRSSYRRRPLAVVLEELDSLLAQGVEYVYFIDEIFMPDQALLRALSDRHLAFGVQLRIDLWNDDSLEQLGRAGCVSIEAGVESITEEGRSFMNKPSFISLDEITRRLISARKHVPFVQANLIGISSDNPEIITRWRKSLQEHGVWSNDPVPLFPYPGSALYTKLFGEADDSAWEKAHAFYLETSGKLSDIQDQQPLPLAELEVASA